MFLAPTDRPDGWNLVMETLASLPREPTGIALADLCADFGLTGQAQVREALKVLKDRGHAVQVFHGERGSGNHVWVTHHGWKKACRAAEKYWDRVYPQGPASADLGTCCPAPE